VPCWTGGDAEPEDEVGLLEVCAPWDGLPDAAGVVPAGDAVAGEEGEADSVTVGRVDPPDDNGGPATGVVATAPEDGVGGTLVPAAGDPVVGRGETVGLCPAGVAGNVVGPEGLASARDEGVTVLIVLVASAGGLGATEAGRSSVGVAAALVSGTADGSS
jgi:hypothetical protein